jgi:hypothetical protein
LEKTKKPPIQNEPAVVHSELVFPLNGFGRAAVFRIQSVRQEFFRDFNEAFETARQLNERVAVVVGIVNIRASAVASTARDASIFVNPSFSHDNTHSFLSSVVDYKPNLSGVQSKEAQKSPVLLCHNRAGVKPTDKEVAKTSIFSTFWLLGSV